MSKNKNTKLFKLLLIFFIIILSLILFIKMTIDFISFINNPSYSAPWYLPIIFDFILFMIPISICAILLFVMYKKDKKQ